ncbi:SpoIIE family protein phosphatase [Streptomyces sp. ME19-01-6]|uniref:SpoIIE family protein phosphatase n=1 Tax=Streptomyces sp. ME19-01-6 TaxID=3028686 RepID=UPI0029B05245|nr:SpoIIE family protein phosphatase [Streptomyces sp. ME19-01-6]MDX3229304.1 SpoIIE family protein phosphatase [Streptomyces sp. ME19-01-6]
MAHRIPCEGPDRPAAGAERPTAPPGRVQRAAPADRGRPAVSGPAAPAPGARDARGGEAAHGAGAQTERLRYLDEATRRIARGMDPDETLCELCRAATPAFADAAFIHLCEPLPTGDAKPTGPVALRPHTTGPRLRAPAAPGSRAAQPGAPAVPPDVADARDPWQGAEPTPEPDADPGPGPAPVTVTGRFAELLLAGRPVFGDAPGVAPAVGRLLRGAASGHGPLPPTQRLIVAPLRGRHHVIGTVTLLREPGRPAFTPDDLLVASQLATHTALGIDKAVRYGREASVADVLQRAMLPSSLPEATGVRLASRYLPASETARVGGDWYDAIPLPGNRVALVIGDVMGHSMTSAAVMGQLRTTVQTLAGLDLPPEEVLYHLDEQAQRLGSQHIATCLYAIYDPIAHRLQLANAGHPPPLLLHPDGRGEALRIPPGAPIGVGGVVFECVETHAPAGATLLLYTDGLVESRETDVWTGVESLCVRLRCAAAHTPAPMAPEDLCDLVLGPLDPGNQDDDVALLAARFDGIPWHNVAYWFLDPQPQTAGRARRLARRTLHRWKLDPLIESTELLVSEVVTNAVRYATRPLSLRLLRTDVLRCEVGDDSPQLPRMRRARLDDEGGRGLFLVSRFAERWGATRLSTGKVVWFEQRIPQAPPTAPQAPHKDVVL